MGHEILASIDKYWLPFLKTWVYRPSKWMGDLWADHFEDTAFGHVKIQNFNFEWL